MWVSVYQPDLSTLTKPAETVFSGDTNDLPYEGDYGSEPGEFKLRPGWGYIHGSLGFERHGDKLIMGYLDSSVRAVNRATLVNNHSVWSSHEEGELTGDFMIRFGPNLSCKGTRVHHLPAQRVD